MRATNQTNQTNEEFEKEYKAKVYEIHARQVGRKFDYDYWLNTGEVRLKNYFLEKLEKTSK